MLEVKEKFISWLKYFFGAFFSHESSRDCVWRSIANTALSMLLAFIILVFGLVSGYRLSFGYVYRGAEEFRSFAYAAFDSLDAEIEDGKMSFGSIVNTYDNESDAKYIVNGYNLIADFRDTRGIYDDFTAMCVSETRPEITYEEYLLQPAYIQQDYSTFRASYSGEPLDIEANFYKYHEYLVSVTENESSPVYEKEVAEAFFALEAEKGEDYYEQIYLLYIDTYYPELKLSESNAKAPTLHGYYYNMIASDEGGAFMALFGESCYISFASGSNHVFFVGDYSTADNGSLDSSDKIDKLLHSAFDSTEQVDIIMYGVNVFGVFAIVILLWIILLAVFTLISKKLKIRATDRFGASGVLVGMYIWFSSVIAAAAAFVLSFFMSQGLVFYLAAAIFILTFIARSIIFLVKEAAYVRENPSEYGEI